MKKIPLILIYSRVVFGLIIMALSVIKPEHYQAIIIVLITSGLISDIFDGIIARKLNVSTEFLRRLDSGVDQFFWIAVLTGCYLACPLFFQTNLIQILLLAAAEITCYAVCYIKFKKEVATHAISSKLWALVLFATLIQVTATCNSVILFNICFYLGIITRLEIIAMLLVIKRWTNDIPTLYHAFKLRNNKPIKRHKLFNG